MKLIEDLNLDLENLGELYPKIEETIKYLEKVKQAIADKVLAGEKIDGLEIKEGAKVGTITADGYKYLANVYGDVVIYEFKGISQAKLKELVDNELIKKEDLDLVNEKYMSYKQNKNSVKVTKK